MRTSILLVTILFTGIFSSNTFAAQENTNPLPNFKINKNSTTVVFSAFNVHRQQTGVSLNWIVSPITDISSFVIKRSYDGLNFMVIDEVLPQSASWNRYRDNTAFPGYIWYQIDAVLNDGTVVSSTIEQVRIVSKK